MNRPAIIALAAVTYWLPAHAADLSEKSPFLPAGYGVKKAVAPKPVPQANGPLSRELEFRGLIQLGDTYRFSIFNKKENKSYWITEKDPQNGISAENFDPEEMSIEIRYNGRTERITLISASDSPLPVQKAQPNNARTKQNANLPRPTKASNNNQTNAKRTTIPRRRVILPKKN